MAELELYIFMLGTLWRPGREWGFPLMKGIGGVDLTLRRLRRPKSGVLARVMKGPSSLHNDIWSRFHWVSCHT